MKVWLCCLYSCIFADVGQAPSYRVGSVTTLSSLDRNKGQKMQTSFFTSLPIAVACLDNNCVFLQGPGLLVDCFKAIDYFRFQF